MRIIATIVFASLFAVGATAPIAARADTTGAFNGRATELGTAKAMSDIFVRVWSPAIDTTTHTNARGYFVVLGLPPDSYNVSFAREGYNTTTFYHLALHSGQEIHLTVTMCSLRMLDCFGIADFSTRLAGLTADVYTIREGSLQFGSPLTVYGSLLTVPGVTIGSPTKFPAAL